MSENQVKLWKLIYDYVEKTNKATYINCTGEDVDFIAQCDSADEAEHKLKMFIATLNI